jgi:wobble nucleotide-excising tRNase
LLDLEQLILERERLMLVKLRFEKKWIELCLKYVKAKTKLEKLYDKKDAMQDELVLVASEVFAQYGTLINQCLKDFGVDFVIESTRSAYVGQSRLPRVEYVLKMEGCEIQFDGGGVSPCIKNVLSEGDKRALALAFFLARLHLDKNIGEKVVVFDDPMSSFDRNRRHETIRQLVMLSSKAKQLIVLTHDKFFARELWNELNKSICKTICIQRAADGNVIRWWDVEKETSGEYFENFFILEAYLNGEVNVGDQSKLRNAARCIRPLLENYLKIKFPGVFSHNEWLGDYIAKIRAASSGDPLFILQPKLGDLESINDYSKKYHHANNLNADHESITDHELKNFVNKTLELLYR